MRFRTLPGRFVAVALGIAGIAAVHPDPVHSQEGPTDGPPPFVGWWWEVDRPVHQTSLIVFDADGGFEQRQGDLEAASHQVDGDSIRLEGGTGEYAAARLDPSRAGTPQVLPFRVRGDTLQWGGDDATILRVGDPPRDADDSLEGRWRRNGSADGRE